MSTQYFLDAPHDPSDILTPILFQHDDWWSRHVEAWRDRDGDIVLRGTVASFFQKQLAQEAFRSSHRDARIRNELRVSRMPELAGCRD